MLYGLTRALLDPFKAYPRGLIWGIPSWTLIISLSFSFVGFSIIVYAAFKESIIARLHRNRAIG